MPGQIYSAHATVTLTGSGTPTATMEAYITAPSTHHINLLNVIVSGNYDSTAGDDPIIARLVKATSVSGGTTITPSKHAGDNSLSAQAVVHMDGVTASETSNTCIWDTYVNPKDSFRPALVIKPSDSYALELKPGAQNRTVKISFYWEE